MTLAQIIRSSGQVLLINSYGARILACTVAHMDMGIYDNRGRYYSMTTLKVDGFTLAK